MIFIIFDNTMLLNCKQWETGADAACNADKLKSQLQ